MLFDIFIDKFPNCNTHYLERYLAFISSRTTKYEKTKTHYHHILPKSKDMFPIFKNLTDNPWNGVHLTIREHFIAHWMLHKALKGSSQTVAFFHMINILGTRRSKDYAEAKKLQQDKCKLMAQDPARNMKISIALKDKPKSAEHRSKLGGPRTDIEKENISKGVRASGFKFSAEQKLEMSKRRTGISKAKNTLESKLNIAASKCNYHLITPRGIFESHLQAAIEYKTTSRRFVIIFQNLDIIPRSKVLEELNITEKGKTYRELGFSKMTKL